MASADLVPRFESSPRTYCPTSSRVSVRVRADTKGRRKSSSRGASPRRRPGGTRASRRSSSSRVRNRRSRTCLLARESSRGVVGQRVPAGQTGDTVELVVAWGERLRVHYMPKYAPETNSVEEVWWRLHEAVTRNHRCGSMQELIELTMNWLDERRFFRVGRTDQPVRRSARCPHKSRP